MSAADLAPLSTAEFAALHDVDVRTVKRWLQKGKLPGAVKNDDGRWEIPAGTPMPLPTTGGGVVGTRRDTAPAPAPAPAATISPLGVLVPLPLVAELLGTEVGRVKRMGRDGLFIIGPYLEHGVHAVFIPGQASPGAASNAALEMTFRRILAEGGITP